jgi:Leucine-rich repeat (LRR) protein
VTSLRLSDNSIGDVVALPRVLPQLVADPRALTMLDLSHNAITSVGKGIAQALPNLAVLYLHANRISELREIVGWCRVLR